MSAPRKRFEEHSPRWQRNALKEGIEPRRWNAWFKLSPTTRKTTDAREYGKGQSVADQKRAQAEAAAAARFQREFPNARMSTVKYNVRRMDNTQLRFMKTASKSAIQRRAAAGGTDNLFWYR